MVSRDNRHEPTAVSKATSSPGGTKHPAKRAKRCRNGEPLRWLCKLFAVQPRVQPAVRDSSGERNQQGEFSQGWPRQRSLAHTRTSSSRGAFSRDSPCCRRAAACSPITTQGAIVLPVVTR